MKKASVIVIPGLGGSEAVDRVRAVASRWVDSQTSVHLFDSKWDTNEEFDQKLKRLISFLESNRRSDRVVVVGYSAGGALATSLYAKRKEIDKIILLSAKIKGSNTIGSPFVKRAPTIIEAVKASEKALSTLKVSDLRKFISFRPIFDGVVPLADMVVEGMRKRRTPVIGHSTSIGFALFFHIKRAIL